MEIYIQGATSADYEQFKLIEASVAWESLSLQDKVSRKEEEFINSQYQEFNSLLSDTASQLYVAKNNSGKSCGYILFGIKYNRLTTENEGWIYSIYVMPEYRNFGIGKKLMEFVESLAREKGLNTIGLMVASHKDDAKYLYDKMRYVSTNELLRKKL